MRRLALGMVASAGLLERSDSGCTVAVNMSELDSGLVAARLPPEKLPLYHPHHRAKHELLRRYMDVWLPKLGFSYGQVALVDGFASAGRYRDSQRGSPLIMLDAYLGRSAADRARFKQPPHFIFIESRKQYAQHLKAEVEDYSTTHGAIVDIIHGSYEDAVPKSRCAFGECLPSAGPDVRVRGPARLRRQPVLEHRRFQAADAEQQ